MSISFKPLWFDSMGAKSTSTLIKTPDISIVIDPGISTMHPSFPASNCQKNEWYEKGRNIIMEACRNADIITISHYHLDHYFSNNPEIYKGKTVFAKNPNEYINDKQRIRCEEFNNSIIKNFQIKENDFIIKSKKKYYPDPIKDLSIAMSKDFGSYNNRRKEVLNKGKRRFEKRVKNWEKYRYIPEIKNDSLEIIYPEGKTFNFGKTTIRFSKLMFHGIEYASVGWVFATIIEYEKQKLIHSSDLSGPIIEDYAEWIIKENPDILILDGPPTYLFGYILNRINLNRSIENTIRIIKEIDADVIIFDHHLTREKRFRERTKEIWDCSHNLGKNVLTAAEHLGMNLFIENI